MTTIEKKKDDPGYQAGRTANNALSVMRGAPNLAAEATGAAPAIRSIANTTRGFARGLAGAAPQAAAAPAAAAAAPAGGQAPGNTRALPNAPTGPAWQQPLPQASGQARTLAPAPKPGDPQTYTGGDGQTRQLPSYAPAEAVPAGMRAATPVTAMQSPTQNAQPRVQGAIIGNPGGAGGGVYGGEAQRRLEIALSTVGKGSPTVRRGLIDAYMQSQGGDIAANQAKQNAGAALDLQQQANVAAANEGFATRDLTAQQSNEQARQFDVTGTEQARQFDQGGMQVLTGESGGTSVLRNDGSLTELQGADGQPFRAMSKLDGQITPALQFEGLNQQIKSINENALLKPEERAAMIQPIQKQLDALLSGGNKVQHASPSEVPEAAVKDLRANPGSRAQFDAIFGPGAAARYLGN